MPVWALAFSTALLLTLVGTPLVRRLALATDLVDKPGDHKSHHIPTPYLGGVTVVVSVLVGFALDFRLSPRVGAVAFTAAILGAIGLVDDDRTVDPRFRFAAQFAAAAAAVAMGLRIHPTGVTAIDVALTILWIVGVTNAFNLLDNMDGLTAGVAAVAAAAVFSLAIFAQQPVLATLAAALAGSCVGFLAYNRPPASIFLGDAGSLFVGFVVAILTIDVTPALEPPFGFIIPLVILGLPVLDTTTVTLGRLRRGRSVAVGGRDHLSHRLVALGLSRRNAVMTLVGTEAVLGALAVLGGRRVIQVRWTVLGSLAALGVVALLTSRADVYHEAVTGFPRKLKLAFGALLVATPLVMVPAFIALGQAAGPGRAGHAAAIRALDGLTGSVGALDVAATTAEFELAAREFSRAEAELRGPLVTMSLVVPGMATNLQASRTLASMGRELSEAGARLARVADGDGLTIMQGSVPVDRVRALATELSGAVSVLSSSQKRLAAIDRPFLLPPLQRAVRDLDRRVDRETETLERASRSAQLLPAILGGDGPRRYLLTFQDGFEMRGTGGFTGNWGELVARDGRLELSRFGTPQDVDDTSTVNVSPDFPTAARVITDRHVREGGQPVDGVIAIDPAGLSALLELTGPVTVPNRAAPVDAGNVVDVVTKEAYDLRQLSQRVLEAFTSADLGAPSRIAEALSRAAGDGNLTAYLNQSSEQGLVESLGAGGTVAPVQGDSLLVVSQLMPGDDGDFGFGPLRRTTRYAISLDPGRRPAPLSGTVQVTLETPQGAPPGKRAGLAIYTPFSQQSATFDGQPLALTSVPDLGRQAHSVTVTVPPGSNRTLAMEVRGQMRLSPDGWYRLDVLKQPTLGPGAVDVSVDVPQGWRIVDTRGARRVGERRAEAEVDADRTYTVWVRMERASPWARVWARLMAR